MQGVVLVLLPLNNVFVPSCWLTSPGARWRSALSVTPVNASRELVRMLLEALDIAYRAVLPGSTNINPSKKVTSSVRGTSGKSRCKA